MQRVDIDTRDRNQCQVWDTRVDPMSVKVEKILASVVCFIQHPLRPDSQGINFWITYSVSALDM
jgi:hypothetical protein